MQNATEPPARRVLSVRVLLAHNTYQHAGGEDSVVANERDLLIAAGHEVHLYTVSNEGIRSLSDKFAAFLHTPHNNRSRIDFAQEIDRFQPDIVHVHNTFPLLSPAIYSPCHERGIPVVQTLHNYRTVCANALLMRQGRICEKCVTGSKYWGVYHRCYRNSAVASLAVVRLQTRAVEQQTWHNRVDRFIALTRFARDKFIQAGLPADRIVIKPNLVPDPLRQGEYASHAPARLPPEKTRRGALYVGRLSEEKGVDILVRAWRSVDQIPLRIVGDGPQTEQLKALAPSNVAFVGRLNPDQVRAEMLSAAALIQPSICYEGFPATIAEAYSSGLPVIASDIGSLTELVEVNQTGILVKPGDVAALAVAVNKTFANADALQAMSRTARLTYEASYTAKNNLAALEGLYSELLSAAR